MESSLKLVSNKMAPPECVILASPPLTNERKIPILELPYFETNRLILQSPFNPTEENNIGETLKSLYGVND